MLRLDEYSFDQDMNGGWRALAKQEGCLKVAADLIRDYRETKGLNSRMLYWHEGQLRAMAGAAEQAIELFEKSRNSGKDSFGWNLYVDATIAFLRQDKARLIEARKSLAQLPRPADFHPHDHEGNTVDVPWPPNLDVVDMLLECFGREYKEAYGNCRK